MGFASLAYLAEEIRPYIENPNTDFVREPVDVKKAVAMVIHRLAHGESPRKIGDLYNLGASTVIKYTKIITGVLANMNNVLLQGVCDADKVFWDVCCNAPGGLDNATHFRASSLWRKLREGEILQQPEIQLQSGAISRPVLVDGGSFEKLNVDVKYAAQTVLACCVLHNFCQIAGEPEPEELVDNSPNQEFVISCEDEEERKFQMEGMENRRILFLEWLHRREEAEPERAARRQRLF
ncbi:hypothetical protein KI387_042440 [Taxus chinensis]|uniref:DDE Tnp4 domain-containing protein n=1 Tax=Taxus chinensis TaxID=29808 RepID=A0AA38C438_TAXCH|nr:hypothetical protein KI387_042440 [Taxus chinensis]